MFYVFCKLGINCWQFALNTSLQPNREHSFLWPAGRLPNPFLNQITRQGFELMSPKITICFYESGSVQFWRLPRSSLTPLPPQNRLIHIPLGSTQCQDSECEIHISIDAESYDPWRLLHAPYFTIVAASRACMKAGVWPSSNSQLTETNLSLHLGTSLRCKLMFTWGMSCSISEITNHLIFQSNDYTVISFSCILCLHCNAYLLFPITA